MRRFIATVAVGLAASALHSSPALGAPPESAAASFLLSDTCSFPLQVELTGKAKVIEHGDRLITIGAGQKATLTNTRTGETIRLSLAGAFHEKVLPNGDLLGKGTGNNVFGRSSLGGLIYTTGNVTYIQNSRTGVVTFTGNRGKLVDLCKVLA